MSSTEYSIVIPCHASHVHLLQSQIMSLAAWRNPAKQVVIVTATRSRSGRSSPLVVETRTDLPFEVKVLEVRKGATAGVCRNRGVAQVKSGFVLMLDADDMLHPDAVTYAMQILADGRADIVTFGFIEVKDRQLAKRHTDRWNFHPGPTSVVEAAELAAYRRQDRLRATHRRALPIRTSHDGTFGAHHGSVVASAATVRRISYGKARYGEDIDFLSRALDSGERIAFIDQPWLLWIRDQSTTSGAMVNLSRTWSRLRRALSRIGARI